MIFLLLNVIFGSAFMLFIKWAQVRQREDMITIGALNYMIAAGLIAPFFFSADVESFSRGALLTGSTMGACYFIAYFFVNFAIRWIGAASSTVIAVLSIMLPIAFGIWVWGEDPSQFQVAGIVLALGSLLLIGGQKETGPQRQRPWFTPLILVIFFLLCGTSRLAQEAFRNWCSQDEITGFNFLAFSVAAVPSLVLLLVRRKGIGPTEWLFGAGMGIANALQTWFILEALQRFEGFIVFPVVSAGSIILTALVATRLLGEQLTGKTWVGILLAAISLVLLKGIG